MPGRNQFVVPQFLDVEAKIIGPVTARQFIILLSVVLIEFIVYKIFLNIFVQLFIGVPVLIFGVVFAFFKVNGLPFHFIALNMIQTMRKPLLRVWDKTLSDADLHIFLQREKTPEPAPPKIKPPIEQGRLSELTLVVNTGGVYTPEE